MSAATKPGVGRAAERHLGELLAVGAGRGPIKQAAPSTERSDAVEALIAADLAVRRADGSLTVTEAGRAHYARLEIRRAGSAIDPFLGQHLDLSRVIGANAPTGGVTVNQSESPLAWLVRRKGRDGRALIEPVQFQAGERLRADFTSAQMMPRITANWNTAVAQDRRTGGAAVGAFSEAAVAARQRVRRAFDAVGPEFTGLLLDVCCFLKRLEDVERERGWPPRSAKVVLQLGLGRLARHYGYAAQARGAARAEVRTWLAPDAAFVVSE